MALVWFPVVLIDEPMSFWVNDHEINKCANAGMKFMTGKTKFPTKGNTSDRATTDDNN